jgi:hypothetical protein
MRNRKKGCKGISVAAKFWQGKKFFGFWWKGSALYTYPVRFKEQKKHKKFGLIVELCHI